MKIFDQMNVLNEMLDSKKEEWSDTLCHEKDMLISYVNRNVPNSILYYTKFVGTLSQFHLTTQMLKIFFYMKIHWTEERNSIEMGKLEAIFQVIYNYN